VLVVSTQHVVEESNIVPFLKKSGNRREEIEKDFIYIWMYSVAIEMHTCIQIYTLHYIHPNNSDLWRVCVVVRNPHAETIVSDALVWDEMRGDEAGIRAALKLTSACSDPGCVWMSISIPIPVNVAVFSDSTP
jgi:hypothetical protein